MPPANPNVYFEVFSTLPSLLRPFKQQFVKIYKSELVKDTLTPQWKPIVLNVKEELGGLDRIFRVECWHHSVEKGTKEMIGAMETTFREWTFVNNNNGNNSSIRGYQQALIQPNSSNSAGALSVDSVKESGNNTSSSFTSNNLSPAYQISLSGRSLAIKDGLLSSGSSDVFFVMSATPHGHSHPVNIYRSEVIHKNHLSPEWKTFVINASELGGVEGLSSCSGLTVTVWDWDHDGSHDLIGSCTATLRYDPSFPHSFLLLLLN